MGKVVYKPANEEEIFIAPVVEKKVDIKSLKDILNTTKKMVYFFYNYSSQIPINTFVAKEDTSEVTSMQGVCHSANITVGPLFDTGKVTDMSGMFAYCNNLTEVPMYDTKNVEGMEAMFYDCRHITSIPAFDTHKVRSFSGMLAYCDSLVSIPLFDLSSATYCDAMFYHCVHLTEIPALNFSSAITLDSIFGECSALTAIHAYGFKVDFDISASTLFTREALVEILNNLETVSDTKTLTMGETNLSKLTEEDKLIATNKG